jgi:hypothetical protein
MVIPAPVEHPYTSPRRHKLHLNRPLKQFPHLPDLLVQPVNGSLKRSQTNQERITGRQPSLVLVHGSLA